VQHPVVTVCGYMLAGHHGSEWHNGNNGMHGMNGRHGRDGIDGEEHSLLGAGDSWHVCHADSVFRTATLS
jgi:hypothetical protein